MTGVWLVALWGAWGLALSFSISFHTAQAASVSCVGERVKKFLLGNPSDFDKDAKALRMLFSENLFEKFFDKGVTPHQKRLMNQALMLKGEDGYLTQAALDRQTRLLREAYFSHEEIAKMRETGLLGTLRSPGVAPAVTTDVIQVEAAELRPIARGDLWAMQGYKRSEIPGMDFIRVKKFKTAPEDFEVRKYIVDMDGNYHLVDRELPEPSGGFLLVNNIDKNGNGSYVLVREAGEMKFDPNLKRTTFVPKFSLGYSKEEASEMMARLKQMEPEAEFDLGIKFYQKEKRVLDCMEYTAGRQRGNSFLRDNLLATNINYLEGVFFISALQHVFEKEKSKEDFSEARRKARFSDWIANNFNSGINSAINLNVLNRNFEGRYGLLGYGMTLGVRGAAATGFVTVQHYGYKNAFKGLEGADEKQQAADWWNRVHTYTKLPINEFTDRMILRDMPIRLFENCLKGGAVWMFINPTSIRFVEKHVSTGIYWGGRWIFVEREFDKQDSKRKSLKTEPVKP